MDKQIDISYIIGNMLLYKNEVTQSDVEAVSRRLLMVNPNYKIIGNTKEAVDYWKDFFRINNDDKIIRNTKNLELMKMIFSDILDYQIYKDINMVIKKM